MSDTPQVIAQMRQLGMNQPITSYSGIYNPKLIQQLGAAAEGVIATSLAPGVEDSPSGEGLCGALEEGSRPRAERPALHAVSLRCAVSRRRSLRVARQEGKPITGENFRKEMLAIKTFDLPLTGKIDAR